MDDESTLGLVDTGMTCREDVELAVVVVIKAVGLHAVGGTGVVSTEVTVVALDAGKETMVDRVGCEEESTESDTKELDSEDIVIIEGVDER